MKNEWSNVERERQGIGDGRDWRGESETRVSSSGATETAEREQSGAVEQPWAVCEIPGDGSGQLQRVCAH